jgi:hypothetical protein
MQTPEVSSPAILASRDLGPAEARVQTPKAIRSVARMPVTASARQLKCTPNSAGIFAAEWR